MQRDAQIKAEVKSETRRGRKDDVGGEEVHGVIRESETGGGETEDYTRVEKRWRDR